VIAQGDTIIPIPGTKNRKNLTDIPRSMDLSLSAQHLQQIEELLTKYPNTADRYDEASKKLVDK
jgi:aryl-alcohol dehydrogenase-like predicted oxidoreductase